MAKSKFFGTSSSLVAALTVTAIGAAAQPAFAQGGDDEIVVTGSFIRGTPEDAALPVDVITAQDLIQQGSPNALELIKSLPIVGPVLGDSNQFSTGAQGASGAGTLNLRGIGANRTLILLNGRRIAPSLAGAVDTNLLPVTAIGRIEILKDGAAATYGSDAIAGVANFITRRDLEGFEASGEYRAIEGSDGDYNLGLSWGWRGDRSNIFTTVGYQHRSELNSLDRDWANRPYLENPTGWSILGNPGTIMPITATGTPTGVPRRDANCTDVGGYANFAGTTPTCYFTYVPYDNLVETQNSIQWYGELNTEIADNIDLHVEAYWARNELPEMNFSPSYPPTQGLRGPGSVGAFAVPLTNPGAAMALNATGGIPAGTQAVSLLLWRPLGNGGNPSTGQGQIGYRDYDAWRISASLTGEFGNGVGWDLAATYSENNMDQGTTDILSQRLQLALNGFGSRAGAADDCSAADMANPANAGNNAVGCYWFNPFSNAYPGNMATGAPNPGYSAANANDPAVVAWLFDMQKIDIQQSQLVVDFVLDGETGINLAGGPVAWAAGAQWRRSEYRQALGSNFYNADITPCPLPGDFTCSVRTGPYIFLGQNRPQMLDDGVYAVFGELNIPLTDALNIQAAVRHEDYGGQTGSTTNPKLSARWEVADFLVLRGSVGTTFRGPTSNNRANTVVTSLAGIQAANNNFKSVDIYGNPAIEPETAFAYNLGAVVERGGFRAIVDYWSFEIEDGIVTTPAQAIANAVANGPGTGTQFVNCAHPLRNLITFSNNDTCTQGVTVGNDIARVRTDVVNGPTVTVSGIDAQLDYIFDEIWGGSLSLGVAATYMLEYEFENFVRSGTLLQQGYDAVGFANYNRTPGTVSEWRGTGYVNFNTGPANIRYQLNYVSGVTDDRTPISVQNSTGALVPVTIGREVDDFLTHDVYLTLDLPWETTVTASIVNFTDEDPPEARLELSYDPYIGNPLGRTFEVGVRKRF